MGRELRGEFHHKLQKLDSDLAKMGLLTREQLEKALQSLVEGRPELATEVIGADATLDAMETDLEIRCVQLLATEGPVASDLRLISSIFKITGDLERIGDHAVKIAHLSRDLKRLGHTGDLFGVPDLGTQVVGILRDTMQAFGARDVPLARDVRSRDKAINELTRTIDEAIVARMEAAPQDIDYYSLLHFIPGRL
ncbi:MAG TPA: phosphate signaling complex protein PhoU, partial [bacterium]|nr:phosphate signaling complex protein PhoU [bacterium]